MQGNQGFYKYKKETKKKVSKMLLSPAQRLS